MENQSTLLIDGTPLLPTPRADGLGRTLRVLVVEDDAAAAHIACALLRALDAEVEHVSDAEAAMARLTSAPPDLVLVDIGLPGASGVELVRASQARRPGLPHVMISSRSDVEDVIAAIRHGAEDYVVKPLTGEKLRSALARVLNRPRPVVDAPRQRVLAIGAHPDDVEIGVGGTLRRHSAEGDDVTILTLTGGEQGGDSSRRVQEARRAAEILGCRLVIESLEDTMISAGPATIQVITDAVERFDPTVIYT
ncbi:MAG TPA: response regulator, partial [Gemmatimonadaceae bacterium]|nr:response regulator [Gemmatimonadaceae bacterium]